MIKHSFVRSSKMARNAFTMSVQQSPNKYADSACLEHKRTDSGRLDVPAASKQNARGVGGLGTTPHEESISRAVHTQSIGQPQTKQRRIRALKVQLVQLNNLMGNSKTLDVKCLTTAKTSTQPDSRGVGAPRQRRTQDLCRGTEGSQKPDFKIIDSDGQVSLRFGEADYVGEVAEQTCVPDGHAVGKQAMHQWQLQSKSMVAQICKVQQAVACLGQEVRMIKDRQENFLQLLQKFGEEMDGQMRSLKQSLRTEMQEVIKSEITKNNQVLFRMRTGNKDLEELVQRRIEEYQLEAHSKMSAFQVSIQDMRSTVSFGLHRLETTCEHLQRDLLLAVESTAQEFKDILQTVKAQEKQLTCISGTLIDIVRVLVNKTSQAREQKPLQVIDLLKSNIVEISTLKSEQSRLSKQINHLSLSGLAVKQSLQKQGPPPL